ncbi:MAG TPA: DMT family transporter [Myxococcaceae bacterium]|jgi:drug/metabolite transporter (DMT)-like permease
MKRGVAAISLACLGIAAMATLARSMSGRLPVGQLIFLRFAVGLVPVSMAFAVQRRLPSFRRPRLLALRGLLGGLGVTGYFLSLEHLPVGPATLLNNTSPAFATVLAAWVLHEPLRPRRLAGLLLAMAGAAVVAFDVASEHRWGAQIGVTAGLASAVIAGGALTSMRALRADTDSLTVLFSFCLIGVLLTAPLAALDWQPLGGAVLWASLGVGLLSAAGQFFLSYGYKFVPVSVGSTTGLLTTVFSWALGAAFLAEGLTLRAFVGALICAAGVLLTAQST